MPHSAPARMTDVGRTVIANLKSNGMEPILHYRADSFNPIDGGPGLIHAFTHPPTQAVRRCNHSA